MGQQSIARPVENVVFDIGKVLIEWDPRHLYQHVIPDAKKRDWFLENVCTGAWNIEQDRGRPWPDAEALLVARHPEWEREIRLFRARWIEMVPHAVPGAVEVLEELRGLGVPLYAITNFAADTLREATAKFPFLAQFRGIVVSGDVGMIKPDPGIYRRLASDTGIDLAASVFIDDSLKNVDGAKAVGMQAIHFTGAAALRRDLRALWFGIQ